MTSDARREPAAGLPSDQYADQDDQIAAQSIAPRLTVNSSELLMLEAELAEILGHPVPMSGAQSTQAALTDTTRVAQVLMGSFGRAWCRHLAAELEQVRPVVSSGG